MLYPRAKAWFGFLLSPAGTCVAFVFLGAFVLIYFGAIHNLQRRSDQELTRFAEQVVEPGWRIRHLFYSSVAILKGEFEGRKFKLARYPGLRASRRTRRPQSARSWEEAHLFLEITPRAPLH